MKTLLDVSSGLREPLSAALAARGDEIFYALPEDRKIDLYIFQGQGILLEHITRVSPEAFGALMEANCLRAARVCETLAPRMNARGGTMVFIASDYALGGVRGASAYAASMGALLDLCARVDREYDRVRANVLLTGVRVSPIEAAYAPGARRLSDRWDLIPERENYADIVDAALFLSDERSAPMRGLRLPVNGGIRTLAHPTMKARGVEVSL